MHFGQYLLYLSRAFRNCIRDERQKARAACTERQAQANSSPPSDPLPSDVNDW
jgi:hypothetical protein